MNYQFDNEVQLNNEAIPFTVKEVNGKEYHFVYSYGNNRFQCRELRKTMFENDSKLLYEKCYKNKKNKAYYAKFVGTFIIEDKTFFLMKIFFDNEEEREWDKWLIPKEYTKRINRITHDINDNSK